MKVVRSDLSAPAQNAEEHVKERENAAPTPGGRAGRRLQAAVSFPSGRDGAHDDTLAHTRPDL